MFTVMCCGCGRVLLKDGTAVSFIDVTTGLVPKEVAFQALPASAFEGTPADCDAFALSEGWSVRDAEGPNHRCPDCRAEAKRRRAPEDESRRGAYIEILR